MRKDFDKIKTFAAGATSRMVPFEYGSTTELRLWAIDGDQEVELEYGVGWNIDSQDILTICDKYTENKITIACVPCPALALPKFGRIENAAIEEVFNDLSDYVSWIEYRLDGAIRLPLCPDLKYRIPVLKDGTVSFMEITELADLNEVLQCFKSKLPFEYCEHSLSGCDFHKGITWPRPVFAKTVSQFEIPSDIIISDPCLLETLCVKLDTTPVIIDRYDTINLHHPSCFAKSFTKEGEKTTVSYYSGFHFTQV